MTIQKITGYLLPEDKSEWPRALASIFATMHSDEQAEFFNEIGRSAASWPRHQGFQWAYMQDDLTEVGKGVIDAMKEHTDKSN